MEWILELHKENSLSTYFTNSTMLTLFLRASIAIVILC